MTAEELETLIASGEGEALEVKVARPKDSLVNSNESDYNFFKVTVEMKR